MTTVQATCSRCLKTVEMALKHFNQVVKRSGKWTCQPCANAIKGEASAVPIGGTTVWRGYVFEKTADGWIQQHRLVMQQYLGRQLLPNEVVHHRNEIKTDNRLENLELADNAEHTKHHHIGARRSITVARNIARACEGRSNTKLGFSLAEEARKRFKAGETQRSIAKDMNVSPMTISRAVRGESWKHYE